jgi:hypothetical protein
MKSNKPPSWLAGRIVRPLRSCKLLAPSIRPHEKYAMTFDFGRFTWAVLLSQVAQIPSRTFNMYGTTILAEAAGEAPKCKAGVR